MARKGVGLSLSTAAALFCTILIRARLILARPPLASHLEMIKFICKDLFLYVYGKQIDNLRTNHRVSYWKLADDGARDPRPPYSL